MVSPTTFTVLQSNGVGFHKLTELNSLNTDTYAYPYSKNLTSIDSLMLLPALRPAAAAAAPRPVLAMFQMTVSDQHPEKGSGLKAAIDVFPNCSAYLLFFVVPPTVYSSIEGTAIPHDRRQCLCKCHSGPAGGG